MTEPPPGSLFDLARARARSFTLENLKKWLDEEKKILETDQILLKENLLSEPLSVDTIYENYFVSNILREPSEADTEPKERKGPRIIGFQKTQRISRLSIGDFVSPLRVEFVKGTQEEFQALAQERGGLTSTEAESLFKRLVDEGLLAMDPEGFWRWL